jgi:hypothetical protein
MRTACRITKATNTLSQYVILIAFPLQQWLRERAPMLRYTYIASLAVYCLHVVDPAPMTYSFGFHRNGRQTDE